MRPTASPEQRSSSARTSIIAAVLFTLAAGAIWFGVNRDNVQEYMETYKNREAEIAEIKNLKQRINQLKRKQQSLAFNGAESEKQIRERLLMHKRGERVIFLVEEGNESPTSTPESIGTIDISPGNATSPAGNQPPTRRSNDAPDANENQDSQKRPEEIRSAYDAM